MVTASYLYLAELSDGLQQMGQPSALLIGFPHRNRMANGEI